MTDPVEPARMVVHACLAKEFYQAQSPRKRIDAVALLREFEAHCRSFGISTTQR